MKTIYILSGLGADERAFQKLSFPGYNVLFIKWITPDPDETIDHYASRLLPQITSPDPILAGLSFGGIMAIEIAKQIETEKIILIASVKTKNELPPLYRFAGKFGLHKIMPVSLMISCNSLNYWLFGAGSDIDRKLLREILHDTDPVFFKWAVSQIVKWQNQTLLKKCFHFHGDRDRILPIRFVKCDVVIKSGGHLMTLNRAEEINKVLQNYL